MGTQRRAGRAPRDDRGRDRSDGSTTPGLPATTRSRKRRGRGTALLTPRFRTVREPISDVPGLWGPGTGSRKPVQGPSMGK